MQREVPWYIDQWFKIALYRYLYIRKNSFHISLDIFFKRYVTVYHISPQNSPKNITFDAYIIIGMYINIKINYLFHKILLQASIKY